MKRKLLWMAMMATGIIALAMIPVLHPVFGSISFLGFPEWLWYYIVLHASYILGFTLLTKHTEDQKKI